LLQATIIDYKSVDLWPNARAAAIDERKKKHGV